MYPTALDLRGRRVVVVGGGAVATRRAMGLIDAGAVVDVIAPAISNMLAGLVAEGSVRWLARGYLPGDLTAPEPAWLVHTATGTPGTDERVAYEAAEARIWCVNAADHRRSAAWTPAVVRGVGEADGIEIAITAGGDPRRAMALRDAVAALLGDGSLPVAGVRRAPVGLTNSSQVSQETLRV